MKDHPEIADEVEHIIRDTLAAEPEKFDAVVEEVHEAEEAGAAESLAEPSGEA